MITIQAKGGSFDIRDKFIKSIPFLEALVRWEGTTPSSADRDNTTAATKSSLADTVRRSKKKSIVRVDMDHFLLKLVLVVHRNSVTPPSEVLKALPITSDASALLQVADFLEVTLPFVITTKEELGKMGRRLRINKKSQNSPAKIVSRAPQRQSENAAAIICLSLRDFALRAEMDYSIRNHLVNDTLYILSHAKTFSPPIRHHVWQTFREHLLHILTENQLQSFRKWTHPEALEYDASIGLNEKGE